MTNYNDEYATCSETYATLRVYPVDIDPNQVTSLFKVEPTSVQLKGDKIDGLVLHELGEKHNSSKKILLDGWFLTSKDQFDSLDIRRHLDWVLDHFEGKRSCFDEVKKLGGRFDISCYWLSESGHGGPTLSPSQCKKLSDLGIDVWFDCYFFED